jgi:hypothetical protein
MDMVCVVTCAIVIRRALGRISIRDREGVFVYMVAVGVMQVTIMKVVDVSIVIDSLVSAAGPVDVVVRLVSLAISHGAFPFMPYLRRSSST